MRYCLTICQYRKFIVDLAPLWYIWNSPKNLEKRVDEQDIRRIKTYQDNSKTKITPCPVNRRSRIHQKWSENLVMSSPNTYMTVPIVFCKLNMWKTSIHPLKHTSRWRQWVNCTEIAILETYLTVFNQMFNIK